MVLVTVPGTRVNEPAPIPREMLAQQDTERQLQRALLRVAGTLEVPFAALFEADSGDGSLAMRAGVGWDVEMPVDDVLRVGAGVDAAVPAGGVLVVPDFAAEDRLHLPALLAEHRVASGVTAAVPGHDGTRVLLGAYDREPRAYSTAQVEFLESVAGLVGVVLERARLEAELPRLRERMVADRSREESEHVEQLALLGTLVAGIAHEINNPLNSIMVNAELGLLRVTSGKDVEKVSESLRAVIEEVNRCSDIMRGVLDLARNRSGPMALHDLDAVIHGAREMVESHLQIHDAAIDLDLADLPPLNLDPVAMESALVNLLSNAAEAAPKSVKVSVRTRLAGDHVHLSVADDGPGIAPERLGRIFDPFFTTKDRSRGTGLGLSLVRRTVSDHGGTIEVRSRPGEGTRFLIRLPLPEDTGGGPAASGGAEEGDPG